MIEIKNLQKILENRTAVDIPALEVPAGTVTAVVGPAGSGKEELFDLLVGKSRPSSGTIRLAGIDPAAERVRFSQAVGILFLEDGLYLRKSPLANLAFHRQLYGLPRSRAEEVLAQVGLADQSGARLDKLPSGLVRRLGFGRAILHQPAVLILFEPFARCDEGSITWLSNLIRQQAGEGTAVLILADDDAHLASLCDALYELQAGRLVPASSMPAERSQALPFKIPVRMEEKVILVNPADILYAEAESGRAGLQTSGGRMATQYTLNELEERLARRGFFRAHRAYLVNLQHIKEVIPYTRNSFSLKLDDESGTEIPLSKAAAGELRDLLGY